MTEGEERQVKWGEQAEQEFKANRARLLESLPPEAREGGERLLRACEADAEVASSTIVMLACTAAGVSMHKQWELSFDVLSTALQFHRFASMKELAEHLRSAGAGDKQALKAISAGLSERARPLAARLKVLLEALQAEGEG
jgi:hypothetical protein